MVVAPFTSIASHGKIGGMEDERLDGWPMPEAELLAILRAIAAENAESR